jgi:hypothetical protein
MVDGAGHTIMLERAEELEALLVEFAQELGLGVGEAVRRTLGEERTGTDAAAV